VAKTYDKVTRYSNIANGYTNLAKSKLGFSNEEIEKIARSRKAVCLSCTLREKDYCSKTKTGKAIKNFQYEGIDRVKGDTHNGCGCLIEAKIRCMNCVCPTGKW